MYEPTYPRKHLTLVLTGVWSDIIKMKPRLNSFFDEKIAKLN